MTITTATSFDSLDATLIDVLDATHDETAKPPDSMTQLRSEGAQDAAAES